MAKIKIKAKGMHCTSCEKLIEQSLSGVEGVENAKADYPTETVEIVFDPEKITVEQISAIIQENGYDCSSSPDEGHNNNGGKKGNRKWLGIIFGVIGILIAGYFILGITDKIPVPQISQNMGYGLLFLVGLLTGFHCVAMCGGFVVSYTAKHAQEGTKAYKSHFMYGFGKTLSYTIIGAAFGLLGSIIAFTPLMRGVAGAVAGIFLIIFGLNMLNVFPWLRKIRIKTPSFMNKFVGEESRKNKSPLIIGLLNGLMIACGPLQAIYIMAAGTGSAIEGAKLLFIFALGTLPVMLSFGFLTSFISSKATHRILKASGVIVIVLGLIMLNRGLALTGTGYDAGSLIESVSASSQNTPANSGTGSGSSTDSLITMENGYQIIKMDVTAAGWEPDKFILKKDVPVKWIINGKEITSCNNAIVVPKLGLQFDIKPGEQTIEFTPDEEGTIPWSCWMGMIRGTFIVKADVDSSNADALKKELDSVPKQQGGTCSMGGGGGCGCGGGRAAFG